MSKAPSAWTQERVMSAWQEARACLTQLDPTLADDDDAITELMREETADADAVVTRLVRAKIEADMMEAALKARIVELSERLGRWKLWGDGCKSAAERMLEIMDWPTLRMPDFTASKGTSRPGVEIVDEAEVPDAYCKIVRSPSRTEIRAALDRGEDVPGAMGTNGKHFLRILRR